MKKATPTLLALSLAFTAEGVAQVTVVEPAWGSQSFASVADRRFSSTSTNFNFAPSNGGPGVLTSNTAISEARGSSSSYSALDATNGISVPLIRTFATTGNSNSAASGGSVVVEGYTYTGSSPGTFNLDATLTGSFTSIDNDFAGNFATLSIWSPEGGFGPPVFSRSAEQPDDGFFFSSDEGSYLEFGFDRLATLRLEQNGLNGDDVTSGTLTWTMDPGETVYLWASGRSQVYGPNSTADARNTLTTSFQDSTGLTSLSGGLIIPEPSAAVLGGLGMMALLLRRR